MLIFATLRVHRTRSEHSSGANVADICFTTVTSDHVTTSTKRRICDRGHAKEPASILPDPQKKQICDSCHAKARQERRTYSYDFCN
eukprot:5659663-Karenia_brevis.AAC.1